MYTVELCADELVVSARSAAALGGLMTDSGDVGGVRKDERALKQRSP